MLPSGLKKPLSTEKEVQEWLTDDGKRSRVLEPFQEFATFVKEYTKQEPQNYANIKKIPIDDKEIALRGINSAWMCGRNKGKTGDYGLAIVGEPQIFDAIEKISGAALKIAVLHHPFDWLAEFDRNRIEDPLKQECDFILRGHQHYPKVEITSGTSGDCVIIPAGASYDRRMAENPRYANSYNFVHLDLDTRKGAVFLRRWSDDGKRWLQDIASCKDGKCDLDLFKPKAKASEETSHASVSVPDQIPPPPLHFKGREQEIEDILSKFEKGAAITGLRGMGGVGKTALALVLADKLKSRFPDGQIYIEMRGTSKNPDLPPLTPEEAMSHVIRSFKRIDRLPENPVDLRNLYNSTLAGKHVLLLLDNAKSSNQIYPLLPPEGCSVLITSRIKFELFGLVEKDLDSLLPGDAHELLLAIAPRIGERADELAKLCGYLPLALRNAAGALAEKKEMKVSDYEKRLRDKVARLELIKGSFSLSYDLLTPLRKKNWRRLSVFPEDFDQEAAIAVLKMSPEASTEALSDLVRWSLGDYIPAADYENGRYKLHDLARDFAESYLTQDELIDIQQRHANHYLKVLSQADNLYLKGGTDTFEGLKLFDLEWANIEAGQAWAKSTIRSKIFSKKDFQLVMDLAWSYANDGVYVLDLRLHPRNKIGWLETGLDAARIMKDRGAEGYTLGNLGSAYSNLGETRKAIEFCEQALAISKEIGDRRGEGNRLSNLGSAYSNLGETRKAIEFYNQALKIVQEIGDRRNEGTWLGNLGSAHLNLGETRKAIEFHDQALKISQEIGDRRGEGNHLGNLGSAHLNLGETRKAIEFYEQALAIAREISDKQSESEFLCNLGKAYLDLKDTDKAIDYCTKSLDIVRKIEYRKFEAEALCALGRAFTSRGDLQKALDHCDQALKISREIEYPKGEAEALFARSRALHQLGKDEEAASCAQEALAIFQRIESHLAEKVRQELADWGAGS
jgi:tetratricopeptide (TPR) repeat protein